jgi:hypothetical protein
MAIARILGGSLAILGAAVIVLAVNDRYSGSSSGVTGAALTNTTAAGNLPQTANSPARQGTQTALPVSIPFASAVPAYAPAPAASRAPIAQASFIHVRTVTAGNIVQANWTGAPAMPSGSRFQLAINTSRAGHVAVYAVNPDGVRSTGPAWSGYVPHNGEYLTPMLRLEGTRGMETLKIVLKPTYNARGQMTQRGSNASVQVWHY